MTSAELTHAQIASIIGGIFGGFAIMVVYAAWRYEPFVSKPPQHHPIVRCPDCHLVKQPPSECGHETQSWAWLECTRIENLYPAEVSE